MKEAIQLSGTPQAAPIKIEVREPAPAVEPKPTRIDIRKPRMVEIFEPGKTDRHVAVEYPDFGLIFLAEAVKIKNRDHGRQLAKECRALGHDDWVLAEIEELQLTRNFRARNPATFVEHFPNTPSEWFISNTDLEQSSGPVWGVFFCDGDMYAVDATLHGFGRFVRRVSPSQ